MGTGLILLYYSSVAAHSPALPHMACTNADVVRAYRHLYQFGLRAVCYSGPARYTIRDKLRTAFRKGRASEFDPFRIHNTLQFLHGAAQSKSLEHKVLRSLLHTWYWEHFESKGSRSRSSKSRKKDAITEENAINNAARDQYNHTIRMLNESMGMCIR